NPSRDRIDSRRRLQPVLRIRTRSGIAPRKRVSQGGRDTRSRLFAPWYVLPLEGVEAGENPPIRCADRPNASSRRVANSAPAKPAISSTVCYRAGMTFGRGRLVAYWVCTGLFCAAMVAGGVQDLLHTQSVVELFNSLGYPMHLATILGVWKLLGAAALLAPKLPRVKEWAYAGFAFDLTGASASA